MLNTDSLRSFVAIGLRYALLGAIALVCAIPFWWTLVTAVSGSGNIFQFPPQLWPQEPTLDHFVEVFRVIPLLTFLKNSLWITVWNVAGTLLVCSLAAYPLARLKFRGRNLVFGAILATMVLPGEVNFLVNYLTMAKLNLVDTYAGVVLPNIVTAFGIFMMKHAFEEIPQDLLDAARMDGASELQVFFRIMLPLTLPWLGTLAILTTVSAWNQYIWPAVVMSRPEDFPLSVGVLYLKGTFGSSTRVIAAGTVLTVLPMLLVFLATQRFFIRGMDGAIK